MPSLAELLTASSAQGAAGARGPQPGRIVSYDESAYVADIDPLVARVEDGASPRLRAVPVLWPWGVSGMLAAGDIVLLVPCERDISAWVGARAAQSVAPSPRTASLSDCVALPMWVPSGDEPAAVASRVDGRIADVLAYAQAVQAWTLLTFLPIVVPPPPPPPPPILTPTAGTTNVKP